MTRGAILNFLNDWRDTIYYGATAALTVWAAINGQWLIAVNLASISVWVREISRDVAWAIAGDIRGPRKDARSILYWSAALAQVSLSYALLSHPQQWTLLLAVWDAAWLVAPCRRTGLIPAMRLWWRDMFDWPRKQKPPKHRWDAAKRRVVDALAKFRPDHVPQPCRVRVG